MAVVGNFYLSIFLRLMWKFLDLERERGESIFYLSIFLRLMWEFLDLERERGDSVCWPNNKIIDAAFCKLYGVDPRHHFYTFAKTVNTKSKSVVIRETMAGLDLSVLDSGSVTGLLHGWRKCRTKFSKDQKKKFDGTGTYGRKGTEELSGRKIYSNVK